MTLLACLRRLEASRTCWMKRSSNTSFGCPGGIIFAKAPRSCSFVTWGPSGPQPFPCSSVRSHRYAIAGGGRGGLLLAMAIVLSMSWMATNRPSTSSWNSSTSGLNDAANAAACPDEGHRSAPRDHGQAPRDVGCKHGHDDCSRRTVRWVQWARGRSHCGARARRCGAHGQHSLRHGERRPAATTGLGSQQLEACLWGDGWLLRHAVTRHSLTQWREQAQHF